MIEGRLSVIRDEERVDRWRVSERRERRKEGWTVSTDLWVRQRTLSWIFWFIVSQWRDLMRIGVTGWTHDEHTSLSFNWLFLTHWWLLWMLGLWTFQTAQSWLLQMLFQRYSLVYLWIRRNIVLSTRCSCSWISHSFGFLLLRLSLFASVSLFLFLYNDFSDSSARLSDQWWTW